MRCLETIHEKSHLKQASSVTVLLYGSLAKTGKGHGTDIAVLMGLLAADPVTVDVNSIHPAIEKIKSEHRILLGGNQSIPFSYKDNLLFLTSESLPYHPNGLSFLIGFEDGTQIRETYRDWETDRKSTRLNSSH